MNGNETLAQDEAQVARRQQQADEEYLRAVRDEDGPADDTGPQDEGVKATWSEDWDGEFSVYDDPYDRDEPGF